MARVTPSISTVKQLLVLSGNECAFPNCGNRLFDENGKLISQLCHIEAAEEGGQRYNPLQSDEERKSFSNLMYMCYEHHKVTDDIYKYTVDVLKDIKRDHELKFSNSPYNVPDEYLDQIFENIDEKLNLIIEQNQNILVNISQSTRIESEGIKVSDRNIYSETLKIGLKLRRDYKFSAALDFYLAIEKENWNNLPEEVQFKLLANIGVTYLDLGEKEKAASYFFRIKSLNQETLDTLSYVCLAYAIINEEEKFNYYFDKALQLGNESENLWSSYLLIKGKKGNADEIKERLPVKFLKLDFVIVKLLEIYAKEGNLLAKKDLMWELETKIYSEDYKEWQIISSYTGLLIGSILTVEKLELGQFSEHEIIKLENALKLYLRIKSLIKDFESPKVMSNIYYNCALCLKALGRIDEMEEEFEKAWNLNVSFITFKAVFRYNLDIKRLEKCNTVLKKWKLNEMTFDEEFQTVALESRLLSSLGDVRNLEKVLLDCYYKMPKFYKPLILDNLINNLMIVNEYQLAEKYSHMLIVNFPQSIYGYIGMYIIYKKQGNLLKALDFLNATEGKEYDKNSEKFLWMQIGHYYFNLEEYHGALKYFDLLGELSRNEKIMLVVAECHFHLFQYTNVVEILKDSDLKLADIRILQLLFASYKNLKDFKNAELILLIGAHRANINEADFFRKVGALFYCKQNDFQKSREFIFSICRLDNLVLDEALELLRLLLSMNFINDTFELAYKIRILFYDDFKIHNYFVHLWLQYSDKLSIKLYLKSAEENSLIVLKDSTGDTFNYYLAGDNKISNGLLLNSDDDLWNLFINKNKGSKVSIPNTAGDYVIKEIHSKLLISLRDSLFLSQNKYAGKSDLYFSNLS